MIYSKIILSLIYWNGTILGVNTTKYQNLFTKHILPIKVSDVIIYSHANIFYQKCIIIWFSFNYTKLFLNASHCHLTEKLYLDALEENDYCVFTEMGSDADSVESWEGDALGLEECLFCSHVSKTLEKNISHMTKSHSFFIPDLEYVLDLEELMTYLGEAGLVVLSHLFKNCLKFLCLYLFCFCNNRIKT